jgi:outer membrane scaffolding protein for murein synthesis (MipA/OmpV family)
MQAFYGVKPAQSVSSGYAVLTPDAGWHDACGSASMIYFFDADRSLTSAVTVPALQGGAKASPIVNEDVPVSGLLAIGDKL